MDIARSPPRFRLRRSHIALRVAALTVSVVAIAALGLGAPAPGGRSSPWIGTAERGQMLREIHAGGVLVPRDTRWMAAGARATLQQVTVQADTVILRMLNPELLANHEKAAAALAGADVAVAAMRTSLASQLLDQQAVQARATSDWRIAEVKKIRPMSVHTSPG